MILYIYHTTLIGSIEQEVADIIDVFVGQKEGSKSPPKYRDFLPWLSFWGSMVWGLHGFSLQIEIQVAIPNILYVEN